MPQITILSGKHIKTVETASGTLLADILALHAGGFELPCGGRGTCGRCRVRAAGGLLPPSLQERAVLGAAELADGVRLACLARVEGEVRLDLPESFADGSIAVTGFLPAFDLSPSYEGFAAAVDLGSTTIAAALCASDSHSALKTAAVKNPQAVCGADVISRLESALGGQADLLASLAAGAINDLLGELRSARDFSRVTITGNTAMLYVLARQNPERLAAFPFVLARPFGETLRPADLDLNLPPETPVYLPRCLSPFVGADVAAGITALRLCAQKGNALLVDIGTNAESALFVPGRGGQLFVCSAPAGPAFEGATLSCGMRSGKGAIESVTLAAHCLVCAVAGGGKAAGLCGSGLVDALAVFLQTGVIDKTGAIQTEGHDFEHLVCDRGGQNAVALAPDVFLTQADIRSVQTAKSAVCAGIQTLLDTAGLAAGDIETVFISGGFGSRLNMQNAAAIGLLPRELGAKAVLAGNTSLAGAFLMNQNASYAAETASLAASAVPVDLSANEYFAAAFIRNMNF